MDVDRITMKDINAKRAVYMAASREQQAQAHQDYYLWLADKLRIGERLLPAEHVASTDEHFNDVPLHLWDRMDGIVRSYARSYIQGVLYWSLSDSVCVLKAVAHRAREARQAAKVQS